MIDEPGLARIIQTAIQSRLRGLHTALPGTVVEYDPIRQVADVDVAIQVEIAKDTIERLPTIPEVPVAWPRGGGASLHFPLLPGDGVLLICLESDPSAWLEGRGDRPSIAARHGLYPVALPGFAPLSQAIAPTAISASGALLACGPHGVEVSSTGVRLGSVAAFDAPVLELKIKEAVADAVAAASAADPSVATGFAAFGSSFAAALLGALNVKAD